MTCSDEEQNPSPSRVLETRSGYSKVCLHSARHYAAVGH